jgi:hypothetical protein
MTDEKPIFVKSTNSDSPEPKEPIDFSGLMKPATETEDDGIIELTEEVQMSSESENEATEIRDKEETAAEDEGDAIEFPDDFTMKAEDEQEGIQMPKEISLDASQEDEEEDDAFFSLTDETAIDSEERGDIADAQEAISFEEDKDDDFFSLTDENAIEPEDHKQLLKSIEESVPDLEEEDESPVRLTDETGLGLDDDGIVDITEFEEQLFPEDQETMDLDIPEAQTAEDDEEFLELIEVEEESTADDEDVVDFDANEDDMENAEIDNFFRKSFDEDIDFNQNVENEVAESLGMELGSEIDMSEDLPEDENRDFKFDGNAVKTKKEELDTILFDDSASTTTAVSGDEETRERDKNLPEDAEKNTGVTELGTLSAQQIEGAVKRFIQQNYSEKIESLITQVIEKAVSKEIEKLKDRLLNDLSNNENE